MENTTPEINFDTNIKHYITLKNDKKFQVLENDISDCYHTFSELYDHRAFLYLALINNTNYKCAMVPDHYEGWDALYLILPEGQISYHVPSKYRNCIKNLKERVAVLNEEEAKVFYDGHTSEDVLRRIHNSLLTEEQ